MIVEDVMPQRARAGGDDLRRLHQAAILRLLEQPQLAQQLQRPLDLRGRDRGLKLLGDPLRVARKVRAPHQLADRG